MILKGNDAEKFLYKINHAHNDTEKQLIMAKITGNFKEEMNATENESHLHFNYTTYKKKCRSFGISLDFLHKNLHC